MNAFCLFYGPTPASQKGDEIRAAGPVEVFGKFKGDFTTLCSLEATVEIELKIK